MFEMRTVISVEMNNETLSIHYSCAFQALRENITMLGPTFNVIDDGFLIPTGKLPVIESMLSMQGEVEGNKHLSDPVTVLILFTFATKLPNNPVIWQLLWNGTLVNL